MSLTFQYMGLSNVAKLLYGLLLDRHFLSIRNELRDKNKKIYLLLTR
ncbi:MAG: hypothetical protein HP001_07620 [Oscillospiraceae bacterium]|nr:hypothetical protein [Oscillospiraceae bacterium]